MINWHSVPFVRIAIPFIAGIIFPVNVSIDSKTDTLLLTSSVLIIFLSRYWQSKAKYSRRWIQGLLLSVMLFLAGHYYYHARSRYETQGVEQVCCGDQQILVARIVDQPKRKSGRLKLLLRAEQIKVGEKWVKTNFKLEACMSGQPPVQLGYGDRLIVKTTLRDIPSPTVPHQFDYKKYMSRRNIQYSCVVDPQLCKVIDRRQGNAARLLALQMRMRVARVLTIRLPADVSDLLHALLLGSKDEFDPQELNQFARSGAMHILCVSGLHVGIIYIMCCFMFGFMKGVRSGMWLFLVLTLTVIWGYAMLTGMSPSVMRASLMFSLLSLGRLLKRDHQPMNLLMASAFVLLLTDPTIIYQLGFQLSYLAVAGILMLYRPVESLISFGFWPVRYIWQLTVVSLTAQFFIFPFLLYHFQQFPNYFILTNLLIIPVVSVLIYVAALFVLLHPVIWVGDLLEWLTTFASGCIFRTIDLINALPYAVSENLFVSGPETMLLMLALVAITYYLFNKRPGPLALFLGFMIVFSGSLLVRQITCRSQRFLLVHRIGHQLYAEVITGNRSLLVGSFTRSHTPERVSSYLEGSRNALRINHQSTIDLNQGSSPAVMLKTNSKEILITDCRVLHKLPAITCHIAVLSAGYCRHSGKESPRMVAGQVIAGKSCEEIRAKCKHVTIVNVNSQSEKIAL